MTFVFLTAIHNLSYLVAGTNTVVIEPTGHLSIRDKPIPTDT